MDQFSWKEEVLLHDGNKIVWLVRKPMGGDTRSGKPPPIKEHTITFTLPSSNKTINWTSEYGEDIGVAPTFICWPCTC